MSSVEWIKFRGSLTKGAKRSLSRATRFIFLELALLARDRSGEILLSPGMSDVDAVHDLLGGNRREVAEALRQLGTVLPGDDDPLIDFVDDGRARYLWIPSWNRENAPPKEKPGASTERSRRFRSNGHATAVASPSQPPLLPPATATQRSGDDRSSGDQIRSDQISPSESAREASPSPAKAKPTRAKSKTSPPEEPTVPSWLAGLGVPSLDDPTWGTEVANWLDRARAKGETYSDWAAAWRTWQRNATKWAAERGRPIAATPAPVTRPKLPPGTGRLPPPMPMPERIVPARPTGAATLGALGASPVPPRGHADVGGRPTPGRAHSVPPTGIGDLLANFPRHPGEP